MSANSSGEKEYSTSEIARILGITGRTVYRWIKGQSIVYRRTGTGRYRFPKSELDRILESRKQLNCLNKREFQYLNLGYDLFKA